jgi:hypothetical protein
MSGPGPFAPAEGTGSAGPAGRAIAGGAGPPGRGGIAGSRYGLFVAILAAIALGAFAVHLALSSPKGATSLPPGAHIPSFAAPFAVGGPPGEVDVATHANEGQKGKVPACSERGPAILNICQLYERGPVVLALFFDAGSCAGTLDDLQQLAQLFPQVSFAAVAIKEEAASVARMVRSRHLTLPVGVDPDGRLGLLYTMVSCPQVTFVYPGGVVQSQALLGRPPLATLRARVAELVAASRARGWKPGRT